MNIFLLIESTFLAQANPVIENKSVYSSVRPTQQQDMSAVVPHQLNQSSPTNIVPSLDVSSQQQQSQPPISPREEALSMMADKKRLKWMREKG